MSIDPAPTDAAETDSDRHPPLEEGASVWRGYRVKRHLNRSLDSDVYLVHSSARATDCIAKCVLPWKRDAERSPVRLRREGELLRRLSHPNIVRGLSVKEEPTGMVLEFLEGQTLHALTRATGDLSWRALTTVGLQVASALQYLHRSGYLHLDLKPENVMMTPMGAKLIDLNLALPPGKGRREVGSRFYLAPEQVKAVNLTAATDVFSFGMTMYAAACCALPAEGDAKYPHLHAPLRPIGERRNLPPRLAQVIDQCISLDPEARPTLPEVTRRLGRMLEKLDELEARFL